MSKLYRASTVCEVIGVKPITLRQWHLRGCYTPESEELPEAAELAPAFGWQPSSELLKAAGEVKQAQRQGWRLYTFSDIVRLLIIYRLTLLGITVERAALMAKHCGVDGALTWPDPRKGGTKPRPVERDSFTVSFLPAEDLLQGAERVTEESEYSRIMEDLVGHSTTSPSGREGLGSLAWAFRGERNTAEAKLFSRNLGVVVNVSAYAREVRAKLSEIEKRIETLRQT